MKKLLFFFAAGIMLSSCSNSGTTNTQPAEQADQKEIVITNDLENAMGVIPSWYNENHVIAMTDPPAHSGEYACLSNDTMQYSYTYKEILKNIKNGSPKLVNFSGWVYTTVANPNFSIVCSVNENQKQYEWKAVPLDKELTETGKWVEFSANFYFDKKPLKPEHEIGMFAWNLSKKNVFIDDLKITFYYE